MSLTRSVSCCFSFSPLQLTGAFPAMKEQLLAEHRSLLLNQVSLDVVIHWLASYYSFPPSTSLLFLIFLFQLIVQVQALLETSTIDCVKNGEGQGSLNYRLDLAEKVMWFYFDIILLVMDDIFFSFFSFSHSATQSAHCGCLGIGTFFRLVEKEAGKITCLEGEALEGHSTLVEG